MRRLLPFVTLALLGGCTVGPNFAAPAPPPPEAGYASTGGGRVSLAEGPDLTWWKTFNSPELNALVDQALAHNHSLASSKATLEQARQRIAALYDEALAGIAHIAPLRTRGDRTNAHHLYVVKLAAAESRDSVFAALRAEGIGANVHYAPVYLHSYYRSRGYRAGLAPVAEAASARILTLPMFPAMTQAHVLRVVAALQRATA